MFAKSKILGVSNGRLDVMPTNGHPVSTAPKKVTASLMSNDLLNSGNAINKSVNAFWQSSYQYMMTGIIPATPELTDSQSLALFFRDMYLHDNVAGSAVDIQSSFPFSDWELRGLKSEDIKIYNDSLERLNLLELLPQISTSYLTDGFFAGSLVFDFKKKQFMDVLIHDALSCEIINSPFHNIDPTITVHLNGNVRTFLDNPSEYTKAYMRTMPQQFIELLKSDAFELDPVSTLFVARRTLTDRAYTSYLQRILPCYLVEKVLFRGTLVEAQRRQRATTHIQAGDDTWIPTDQELNAITQLFQSTESDPLGAWIATRNNIQVSEFRTAGDIWKWYETSESLTPMKLRALGISDAFLSGDASYASSESAYSTFVETVNAYRMHLTTKIFYNKIFPLIAVTNEMYTDIKDKPDNNTVTEFLFNANNRQRLRIPKLHWHKQLEARDEQSQFDMLEKISEHGIPVPLTTWIAAAGMDVEALIRDLVESSELEKKLEPYKKKDEGSDDFGGTFASVEKPKAPIDLDDPLHWTTQSFINKWNSLKSVPILGRKFSDEDNAEWNLSDDGKRHLKVHQDSARKDRLWKLAKVISRYKKDRNYRDNVIKANQKRGAQYLKGAL